MELKEIFALPWAIQLALASGYAAYATAYVGIREHHKTIEITFATLVFGLVTTLVLVGAGAYLLPLPAAIIAFLSTVAAGAIWRRWGRESLRRLQRRADISWSDDTPSAWASLLGNSRFPISQIAVQLDDGTWLRCDDAAKFLDAPFGGCVLGPNGDVALYLTHEEAPGGDARALATVRDPYYGDRMTYVPAARVRRVTVRHRWR